MKGFICFARPFMWLFFVFPLFATAQEATHVYPNYVVIGAFAHLNNAVNFTDDAKHNRFPARFEMNPNRNLYYVYVLTTPDRELAIAEAVRLRAETKYFDTWVYSGGFGQDALADSKNALAQDFDPVTGKKLEPVARANPPSRNVVSAAKEDGRASKGRTTRASAKAETTDSQAGVTSPTQAETTRPLTQTETTPSTTQAEITRPPTKAGTTRSSAKNTATTELERQPVESANTHASTHDAASRFPSPAIVKDDEHVTSAAAYVEEDRIGEQEEIDAPVNPSAEKNTPAPQIPPPKKVSTDPLQAEEVAGKKFYFYLFRTDNGNSVEGEVEAIDFEKSWKMATYPANKSVMVRPPSGESKRISFLCQVFGYRKLQMEFDPANPSEELYLDDQGNLVMPFELMRLQKGDIAIMYNVFFFKDAAVMRPESRYEVNNLLELLKENPSYNIRIHGHTNGNASGKIIRMDIPGNFYSLSGTKQGFGSARKLSEERAIVIKDFLVSSGISEERMEVKAWGGKRPIHDKHSVRANENVRVEIEILSQ